ncbi:hypothetical protein AAVH_28844 [Aphelenchoides avenae]|nr:hypothetical protein AAVH_28844 [Aphelenchus avenae]
MPGPDKVVAEGEGVQGAPAPRVLRDLTLAIVVMVGEPAVLYEDGYFILVADGFFHGRNAVFDFFCVATYCGLIHANCVIGGWL